MTTKPRRHRHYMGCPCAACPHVALPCGCRTGTSVCDEAATLWDKVNVANHNLTVTRRAVADWPITNYHMFGPRRVRDRESIYEYRRAAYNAHFEKAMVPA